jgi:hypothetical protein
MSVYLPFAIRRRARFHGKTAMQITTLEKDRLMRRLFLIFICGVFTVPCVASTLNYSEQNDCAGSDFPSSGSPFLGYLDVGTNTISGWIYDQPYGGLNQDIDTFSVAPVAGTEVISEEINFWETSDGKSISITEPIDGTTNIGGDLDTMLTPATPITGLIDVETQGTPDRAICTGPGGTPPCIYPPVQYAITYTVQDIPSSTPEPSSFVLLGTGLMGFAGMLKRRLTA